MKFLVANWKMNGDLEFTDRLISAVGCIQTQHNIVICPPSPLLFKFQNFPHKLGAQNCSYLESGALTGEISPLLLKALGCQYVIIGHSERRRSFNESNEDIYKKFRLLLRLNLIPIVCVGETLEQKSQWQEILSEQLVLFKNEQNSEAIFAYEPVWSIGTGSTPTENEIHKRISAIKTIVQGKVLYGGSVNQKNSSEILQIPSVDGVLIGGASLKIEEFTKIIKLA